MKEMIIKAKCWFTPPGTDISVELRPGQKVMMDNKQAEDKVKGNVAVYVDTPKPKSKPKVKKDEGLSGKRA